MAKNNVDFKFKDGSKIFFTSDQHFNHGHIIKFCQRPFQTLKEMDAALIENWNEVVPQDGLVFHLGDFAWGGFPKWREIREQLNGEIILIKGNHDRKNGPQSQYNYDALFQYTSQQMFIEIEGRRVYLNHLPFLCYDGVYRDKNSLVYQLHGHVHLSNVRERNNGKDCQRCFEMLFPTQYDVGVDFNNFTPISWNEVNAKITSQVEHDDNLRMWVNE